MYFSSLDLTKDFSLFDIRKIKGDKKKDEKKLEIFKAIKPEMASTEVEAKIEEIVED